MQNALRSAVQFLAGKKSYLVSVAAIVYAFGISRHWWQHDVDVDLLLGGTYGITLRSAIARFCKQIETDPAVTGPGPIQPGEKLFGQSAASGNGKSQNPNPN